MGFSLLANRKSYTKTPNFSKGFLVRQKITKVIDLFLNIFNSQILSS